MKPEESQVLNQIAQYWYESGHLNFDQRDFFIDTLRNLKPTFCLEIGFASGRSAITTLIAARPEQLVSIDLSLDYIAGARAHAAVLQQNFSSLKILEGNSRQLMRDTFFSSNFPHGIDFAFIDGDHSYSGCLADLNTVFPHLNENGIMLVDDYRSGPPNGVVMRDVTRAVDDFVLNNKLVIKYWNKDGKGIAVIKRPDTGIQGIGTVFDILGRKLLYEPRRVAAAIKHRIAG